MRLEVDAAVDVPTARRVPIALIWRDTRWRIIDQPTPLRQEVGWSLPMVTCVTDARRSGWRFTARSAAHGEVRTFDVLVHEQEWWLRNVWD